MAKYYTVDLSSLNEGDNYKYRVICTKLPFGFFKEIITDKIIYPFVFDRGLIYLQSSEIDAEEVENWLKQLSKYKLQLHLETIKMIETGNLKFYEENIHIKKHKKAKIKSANNHIRRTLKQIKQR